MQIRIQQQVARRNCDCLHSYRRWSSRLAPVVRHNIITRSADSFEYVGGVSNAEILKFEKIAASLVAKLDTMAQEAVQEGLGEDPVAAMDSTTPQQADAASEHQPSLSQHLANSASSTEPASFEGFANVGERKRRRIPDDLLPKVAIVGRPNVGKSALFNRIAGASVAVVFDRPGVTRDRLYSRAAWGDAEFVMIDTGGLMSDASALPAEVRESAARSISAADLPAAIERQAAAGVSEAHVVILVCDGKDGVRSGDREVLDWLRQHHPDKPLLLAVNKCDNALRADLAAAEFWELGLQPYTLSSITGTGTAELLDAMKLVLPPARGEPTLEDEPPLAVAIVGRPNVGEFCYVPPAFAYQATSLRKPQREVLYL